jgi:hypothetical protein
MKKIFTCIFILIVASVFVTPVFAQGEVPPVEQSLDLTGLLQSAFQFVIGSAVIAAAATFLVNTGKSAGWVSDTQSITWVSGINFVLIVGVFILKLFFPAFDLGVIERVADGIAKQGPGFILPLMPLLVAFSKWFHSAIKGTKFIGTSYSLKAKRK